MGLSIYNIFTGLNSAEKAATSIKAKKTRTGINMIPGMLAVGYDVSNSNYKASWILPPTSIWYGPWEKIFWISCCKPQPIWKTINWNGSVLIKNITFTDNNDFTYFRPEYESVFGPVPAGPWYIPTFLKIRTVFSLRQIETKQEPMYLISP